MKPTASTVEVVESRVECLASRRLGPKSRLERTRGSCFKPNRLSNLRHWSGKYSRDAQKYCEWMLQYSIPACAHSWPVIFGPFGVVVDSSDRIEQEKTRWRTLSILWGIPFVLLQRPGVESFIFVRPLCTCTSVSNVDSPVDNCCLRKVRGGKKWGITVPSGSNLSKSRTGRRMAQEPVHPVVKKRGSQGSSMLSTGDSNDDGKLIRLFRSPRAETGIG